MLKNTNRPPTNCRKELPISLLCRKTPLIGRVLICMPSVGHNTPPRKTKFFLAVKELREFLFWEFTHLAKRRPRNSSPHVVGENRVPTGHYLNSMVRKAKFVLIGQGRVGSLTWHRLAAR